MQRATCVFGLFEISSITFFLIFLYIYFSPLGRLHARQIISFLVIGQYNYTIPRGYQTRLGSTYQLTSTAATTTALSRERKLRVGKKIDKRILRL